MTSSFKQTAISHGILLFAFAMVAALLIALVNESTRDLISNQRALAQQRALEQVLAPGQYDNNLVSDAFPLTAASPPFQNAGLLNLPDSSTAYIARLDGSFNGVILPAQIMDGYSGTISIVVGLFPDGSISGVRVLEHRETPGLGDKIELQVSDWVLGFNGQSLEETPLRDWGVVKDGGIFDQFVGATITPRAVIGGVKNVLMFYRDNRERIMAEGL